MQSFQWDKVVNKSGWGYGIWNDEPDKVQWPDKATNLPCIALRGPVGSWCGYVGVPPGHPLHGIGYHECPQKCGNDWCGHTPESLFNVHGGLTYSGKGGTMDRKDWDRARQLYIAHQAEAKKYPIGDSATFIKKWRAVIKDFDAWRLLAQASYICHVADAGEPDDVWWFGFDTAHAGDLMPAHPIPGLHDAEVYRDLPYVQEQCAKLAEQLAKMTSLKREEKP